MSETKLRDMSVWDLFTLVIQLAVVVTSIVLAVQGDTTALLGLGALAGGSRGSLLIEIFRATQRAASKCLLVVVLATSLLAVGCNSFGQAWVLDSQASALDAAKPYFQGCKQLTMAPAFSVDWSNGMTYGGGVFVGCEAHGQLVEFRCVAVLQPDSQRKVLKCEPLATWEKLFEGFDQ